MYELFPYLCSDRICSSLYSYILVCFLLQLTPLLIVAEVVEDGDVGPSLVKPDVAVVEVIPDLNRVREGLNPYEFSEVFQAYLVLFPDHLPVLPLHCLEDAQAAANILLRLLWCRCLLS